MHYFLQENAATVVVIAVVVLLVCGAVWKLVKDRKTGVGPCGQRCADCPHAKSCEEKDD